MEIQQNLEKITQFSKEFSKSSAENHVFLMEVTLDYHFTLNYFKKSHGNNPIFLQRF